MLKSSFRGLALLAVIASFAAAAAAARTPAPPPGPAAPAAPPSDCTAAGVAAAFPVPQEGGPETWPTNANAALGIANRYFERGLEQKRCGALGAAIDDFTIALKGAPEQTFFLGARGNAYMAQNRWQEAFGDVDAAVALIQKGGGRESEILLNLFEIRARAEHGLGRYEAEVADLTHIIDSPARVSTSGLDQQVWSFKSRRAAAALAAGRYGDAVSWAGELWETFPLADNWKYLYWRGQARQGLKLMRDAVADYDLALSHLREHIRLSNQPDDVDIADIYAHKGQALLGAQDWVGARTAFEEALKLDKDNAMARAGQAAAPKPPPRPEPHTPPYAVVPSAAAMRAEIPPTGFCSAEVKNAFIDRINAAIQITLDNMELNTEAVAQNAKDRAAIDQSSALTHDEMMSYIDTLTGYRNDLDVQRSAQLAARGPLDALNREALATKISGGCPKP